MFTSRLKTVLAQCYVPETVTISDIKLYRSFVTGCSDDVQYRTVARVTCRSKVET